MLTKTRRPKYLNLLRIRQPVTAVVSILHRLSGVILFLSIPVLVYLFAMSVRSEQDFAQLQTLFSCRGVQIVAIVAAWSFLHHFFAGLRFLLLDLDIGLSLYTSRLSAWIVFTLVAAALFTLLAGFFL